MRCETTVGTEKRKQLVGVSLNAINYRHGAQGEITYFNRRAKRVKNGRKSNASRSATVGCSSASFSGEKYRAALNASMDTLRSMSNLDLKYE